MKVAAVRQRQLDARARALEQQDFLASRDVGEDGDDDSEDDGEGTERAKGDEGDVKGGVPHV